MTDCIFTQVEACAQPLTAAAGYRLWLPPLAGTLRVLFVVNQRGAGRHLFWRDAEWRDLVTRMAGGMLYCEFESATVQDWSTKKLWCSGDPTVLVSVIVAIPSRMGFGTGCAGGGGAGRSISGTSSPWIGPCRQMPKKRAGIREIWCRLFMSGLLYVVLPFRFAKSWGRRSPCHRIP